MTYESPPGVKRNLQRTLNSWGNEAFGGRGGAAQSQTVFSLAWFHAIVQERRTYIPQGWVKAYEYGDGDLKAGLDIINQLHGGGGGDIRRDCSNFNAYMGFIEQIGVYV